jgi:hypothetical protein
MDFFLDGATMGNAFRSHRRETRCPRNAPNQSCNASAERHTRFGWGRAFIIGQVRCATDRMPDIGWGVFAHHVALRRVAIIVLLDERPCRDSTGRSE